MNIYLTDENGVERKLKAVYKVKGGTLVKLKEGSLEYRLAVLRALIKVVFR